MSRRNRPVSVGKQKSLVCNACLVGNCADCADVMRVALSLPAMCPCTRKGHSGEPGTRGDIKDPVAEALVIREMERGLIEALTEEEDPT